MKGLSSGGRDDLWWHNSVDTQVKFSLSISFFSLFSFFFSLSLFNSKMHFCTQSQIVNPIHLLLLTKNVFFPLTIPLHQICHMPMSYWRNAQFWSTKDGPHDIYAGHTVWNDECFWMNDSFAGVRYDLGQSLWFMGRMLSISEAWLATPD